MHWSVIIVCHPGIPFGEPSPYARARNLTIDNSEGRFPADLRATPCIMHLDSLGCHSTDEIIVRVRRWARG